LESRDNGQEGKKKARECRKATREKKKSPEKKDVLRFDSPKKGA